MPMNVKRFFKGSRYTNNNKIAGEGLVIASLVLAVFVPMMPDGEFWGISNKFYWVAAFLAAFIGIELVYKAGKEDGQNPPPE